MVAARMAFGGILGLGLALGGLLLEGGHVGSILQLTAFLIVAGGTFGFLIVGFPWSVQISAWRAALSSGAKDERTLTLAKSYFAAMGSALVMFGLIGAVLGIIHVMRNLDKPEQIGPGVAVAFVALLYGFGLRVFVAGPMADAVDTKLAAVRSFSKVVPTGTGRGEAQDDVKALQAKIGELVMRLESQHNHKDAA